MAPDVSRNVRPSVFSCIFTVLFVIKYHNIFVDRFLVMDKIKKRKTRYLGHLIRREGLLNVLLMGKIEGKKGRGRQRTMWLDNIKDWLNINRVEELVEVARDRGRYRAIVNRNPHGGRDLD